MKKTKKWIIILIALFFVAGIFVWWFNKGDELDTLEKEVVVQGDLEKTISVTGVLTSENLINLNFENVGRIKEIKTVVGDQIIEGEIIAILDNVVLSEQVKKAKAALDKAIFQSKISDDSTREVLEGVDNAEDYLEALEEYQDQLVDAAEIAYDNASNYQEDAESYYDQVVADSGVSGKEAKSALLTLTSAENSKKSSREALETARKGRELNLISAENSLDLAEESLETANSEYAELSRDASVAVAQADYQIALDNLKDSSLKAPLNGLISKINYKSGEVLGSASLNASFGEMMTSDFVIEADIPESDISDLKIGQTAEVTLDAFSEKEKIKAKIIEIDPASTEIQGVIYYKAKLKIESHNLKLKEGMSVDIDVLTNSKQNILKILDQFIFEKDGKSFVFVMSGDELSEREIREGVFGDDGYVEVLSGLSLGEQIFLKEE